jgi:hypothetical protein
MISDMRESVFISGWPGSQSEWMIWVRSLRQRILILQIFMRVSGLTLSQEVAEGVSVEEGALLPQ